MIVESGERRVATGVGGTERQCDTEDGREAEEGVLDFNEIDREEVREREVGVKGTKDEA